MFAFKAPNGLAPTYLSGSLALRKQNGALRSSSQFFAGGPEVKVQTLGWPGFFCCRTQILEQASPDISDPGLSNPGLELI